MKRSFLSIVVLFACLSLFAGPVDLQKAEQTARQFFNKRSGKKAAPLKSVTAKENDMIVVGTKEYIYRKGHNDVLGWFEIGDESEMDWNF